MECSGVGPDYVPSIIDFTDSFIEGGAPQTGDASVIRWWSDLNDRKLDDLVARGLA